MQPMTEQEVEEAVAHDMKILEESWAENGFLEADDEQDRHFAPFDARLDLLEARLENVVHTLRTDLMRWTLVLFCAGMILVAVLLRL